MAGELTARLLRAYRTRLRALFQNANLQARPGAKAAHAAEKAARASAAAEAKWRREFAGIARGVTPYIGVEKDGALFFMSTEAENGRGRFANRKWKEDRQLDKAMLALGLAGIDPAGTTFVDIGAHVGTSTIRALRRHGFASALCFEPEPYNFRILRANLAVNNLDGVVRTFNVALSNHEGRAHLRLKKRGSGSHELVTEVEGGRPTLQVQLTSFDRLAEEQAVDSGEAGLLWVDVQGSEVEVLDGARTLLERAVPLVVEFTPSRFHSAARIASFVDLLAPHYTHFFDLKLRLPSERGLEPLAAIEGLRGRHKTQTDLLVLRLPS